MKILFTLNLFSCLFMSCSDIPWENAFPADEKMAITSFKLDGVQGIIDGANINITLPAGFDVTNLAPEITHTGAGYEPQGAQDFSKPLMYKVSNKAGKSFFYLVSVYFAYKVTFDSNGGGAVQPISAVDGTAVGTLPIPAKTDFIFDGWWTVSSPATQVNYAYIIDSDITVEAHWTAATGTTSSNDLSIKFGITTGGTSTTQDIIDTFNYISAYIKTNFSPQSDADDTLIHVGDFIDLRTLSVAVNSGWWLPNDSSNGYVNTGTYNVGEDSLLLRLMVVGINSFNGKNGNNTPHVVFNFQNLPAMNFYYKDNSSNERGYFDSDIRAYINDQFLTGLINAGVPENVLWAPVRIIAARGSGTPAADTITDKLWIPTEYEIFGRNINSVASVENSSNQASFAGYYTSADKRIKKGQWNDISYEHYWLASPASGSADYFCYVDTSGNALFEYYPWWLASVSPAFCVK